MADEVLDERCPECDSELIRVPADDPANSHNYPVVSCPGCLEVVRVER